MDGTCRTVWQCGQVLAESLLFIDYSIKITPSFVAIEKQGEVNAGDIGKVAYNREAELPR